MLQAQAEKSELQHRYSFCSQYTIVQKGKSEMAKISSRSLLQCIGLSLLSSQSRFSIHISLFPVMYPSGLRSDFCEIWIWGPNPLYSRNFLSNRHLPVHTQRSSSWEEEHSEIQSNRKKKPKPTKPNRGNRRILFPLISDFQKEENAPLGIFRQLHPQTQRCCLSHREFFFKFSLCIFTYFHLPPERSEISSEQFLLPAHSIKKYVAVMTAHRR